MQYFKCPNGHVSKVNGRISKCPKCSRSVSSVSESTVRHEHGDDFLETLLTVAVVDSVLDSFDSSSSSDDFGSSSSSDDFSGGGGDFGGGGSSGDW